MSFSKSQSCRIGVTFDHPLNVSIVLLESFSELREELKPEIIQLIRLNRLNCLTEGQLFHKYGRGQRLSREKGKFWFWKLSTNHKHFHYEDCDEKTIPKFEEMKGKC